MKIAQAKELHGNVQGAVLRINELVGGSVFLKDGSISTYKQQGVVVEAEYNRYCAVTTAGIACSEFDMPVRIAVASDEECATSLLPEVALTVDAIVNMLNLSTDKEVELKALYEYVISYIRTL